MTNSDLSELVKSEALRLGFAVCGITKAEPVSNEETDKLNRWITEGKHGCMSYLERNFEKRTNPQLLYPGCKSIICVAINYYTAQPEKNSLHISKYALGNDYHKVVKDKLFTLLNKINETTPIKGRAFCDTAPLLERYWAVKAGLGWIGKNHMLIIPKYGTHCFLGELLVDTEMEYDTPIDRIFCGNCNACLQSCPTKALTENGFDARKCLSYKTIEYRGHLPGEVGEKMNNCFYGCDICQSICPHNRFATPTKEPLFAPNKELLEMSDTDWYNLTEEKYNALFSDSAVNYCGYEQLKRNIAAIRKK